MTFSICVREEYEDEEGNDQLRFGVAVTTRLPAVGTLCPFVSENGAVATQSLVNVELGRKGIEYIDDGLAVDDALQSLFSALVGDALAEFVGEFRQDSSGVAHDCGVGGLVLADLPRVVGEVDGGRVLGNEWLLVAQQRRVGRTAGEDDGVRVL